eukprot:CAMPEP_0201545610 /NCGR_PEP_ID=MMETSP0173_2-20130828/2066_1 /ASSEMBLY_ACC=CAM_ASM_000268 /TAXON_ID=218659 /ORGANISM="Vexillifera sp., Strain DIVA3 564/2" /LENGTH=356 /DNA_ID=CAMNT_0047954045 /DNA_START=187 /DNA_END=1257 /DNA_ORIENTATION=+
MGESRQDFLDAGDFIAENCAIAGLKLYKDSIFVSVPRWKPGVPSTLNTLTTDENGRGLLQPYPTLAYNQNHLNWVQSFEIDSRGWMWIIDTGMKNLFTPKYFVWNTPKIIVLDLETNDVLKELVLDASIAPQVTFLNDIVVDEKRNFAYITDSYGDGGIITYDFTNNKARRYTGNSTNAEPAYKTNTYCGQATFTADDPTPSDGIALSADTNTLYYCPLDGVHLYTLPTQVLRDFDSSNDEIDTAVVDLGKKLGSSDGLALSSNGILYYGNLQNCSVNYWNTSEPLTNESQHQLVANHYSMDWADTFAFDNKGSLLFTTNRLEYFVNEKMDFTGYSGANFRIWSVQIGENSYLDKN